MLKCFCTIKGEQRGLHQIQLTDSSDNYKKTIRKIGLLQNGRTHRVGFWVHGIQKKALQPFFVEKLVRNLR